MTLLVGIPGVSYRSAQVILAEIGTDMSRFPSAGHLSSWAGMCPGNNESAGKHRSGRTRYGSRWLRIALVEAAQAAGRSKNTYLSAHYARIRGRRGPGGRRWRWATPSSSSPGTCSPPASPTTTSGATTSISARPVPPTSAASSPNSKPWATRSPSNRLPPDQRFRGSAPTWDCLAAPRGSHQGDSHLRPTSPSRSPRSGSESPSSGRADLIRRLRRSGAGRGLNAIEVA